MHRLPRVVLALCLLSACEKLKGSESDAPAAGEDGGDSALPATSPVAGDKSSPAQFRGAIAIPDAIPIGASAVMVARVPESLFASLIAADPVGLPTDDLSAMKAELDSYLRGQLGVSMTDATTVGAFMLKKESFGIVLVGIDGEIKGEKTGQVAGVDVYALPGNEKGLSIATKDDLLLLGSEATLTAALNAHASPAKSMKGSPLGKLIAAETEGAAVVVGVEISGLDDALRSEIPPTMKLDRGLMTFGNQGLKVMLVGEKDSLDQIASLVNLGLGELVSEAERAKKRATDPFSRDGVAVGAASIVATHYARRSKEMLKPVVEDGRLTMSMPFAAGDPAVLAAITGMGAAIAIPAFTRYTRRSKTSEARVGLAKMFDAASSYFNEEHIPRTEVAVLSGTIGGPAPHRCPDNGALSGESGITPPLSVDCSKGPGGRCVPSVGGAGPGYYDMSLWNDNKVWNGLNFQQEQAHYFHYNFIYKNDDTGFGSCQFTAQAFADLDGDGVFSTYERSGAADQHGINAAAGLYIDQEVE